jgi:hypothetical protein
MICLLVRLISFVLIGIPFSLLASLTGLSEIQGRLGSAKPAVVRPGMIPAAYFTIRLFATEVTPLTLLVISPAFLTAS